MAMLTLVMAALACAFSLTALLATLRRRQAEGEAQAAAQRDARLLREELARGREEAQALARGQREELARNLALAQEAGAQAQERLRLAVEAGLRELRQSNETRLAELTQRNEAKLEQIRLTVDEKLHATLEKRLGESFSLVSERLEKVHQGLGEMQNLASGVGDLKRVLSNVKTRGMFGEFQLEAMLEEVLTPSRYHKNHATKRGSRDVVEFAIRLPGRAEGEEVLLPLDAKFPMEDYQRLAEALERGDAAAVEEARKMLAARIKGMAKDIREKYLDPPATTAFGMLYLPTESLYAEVLRIPGLFDSLYRDYRVNLTGPSTLLAFLNSLQMGFRTLAFEKRTNEAWQTLGLIKSEFGKFGEMLDHARKKIQEAGNSIDAAATKSRGMETKLKRVEGAEAVPAAAKPQLLGESLV